MYGVLWQVFIFTLIYAIDDLGSQYLCSYDYQKNLRSFRALIKDFMQLLNSLYSLDLILCNIICLWHQIAAFNKFNMEDIKKNTTMKFHSLSKAEFQSYFEIYITC